MSGEKTRKLDTSAKLLHAMRSGTTYWQQLSDNLLKLEHHANLKNLSRWITKTRHSKY